MFIDPTKSCRPAGSCSFDSSTCLWDYEDSSKFQLSRITGEQLKNLPDTFKPTIGVDKTTNTQYGHFLWVNPQFTKQGNSSLVSETFFKSSFGFEKSCFRFWYFANGPNPGTINLYRKLHSKDR